MGVHGAFSFIKEIGLHNCSSRVCISDVVAASLANEDEDKKKSSASPSGGLEVIVDGNSLVYMLSTDMDVISNYSELRRMTADWYRAFCEAGLTPIIVFDGHTESEKLGCKIERMTAQATAIARAEGHIRNAKTKSPQDIPKVNVPSVPPVLAVECVYQTVREHMGGEAYYAKGEADKEIIELALNRNAYAVMSNDTDMLFFSLNNDLNNVGIEQQHEEGKGPGLIFLNGGYAFCKEEEKEKEKTELYVQILHPRRFSRLLGIPHSAIWLLAAIAGYDRSNTEVDLKANALRLAYYKEQRLRAKGAKGGGKRNNNKSSMSALKLLKQAAEYVKTVTTGSQEEKLDNKNKNKKMKMNAEVRETCTIESSFYSKRFQSECNCGVCAELDKARNFYNVTFSPSFDNGQALLSIEHSKNIYPGIAQVLETRHYLHRVSLCLAADKDRAISERVDDLLIRIRASVYALLIPAEDKVNEISRQESLSGVHNRIVHLPAPAVPIAKAMFFEHLFPGRLDLCSELFKLDPTESSWYCISLLFFRVVEMYKFTNPLAKSLALLKLGLNSTHRHSTKGISASIFEQQFHEKGNSAEAGGRCLSMDTAQEWSILLPIVEHVNFAYIAQTHISGAPVGIFYSCADPGSLNPHTYQGNQSDIYRDRDRDKDKDAHMCALLETLLSLYNK